MPKLKLNCRDLYDQVQSVMKTRYDNDITNRTNAVNAETKLSCHDRADLVSTMTKTTQDNYVTSCKDAVYAINANQAIVTNWTVFNRIMSGFLPKKKKQDNDFTDHIGMVYVDIEIEPSGSI